MASLKCLLLAICLVILSEHAIAKKFFAGSKRDNIGPPPHNNEPLMARYIVHNSDWASVGTISVTPSIEGFPFVGLKSIADGPANNGTGVPYMLMTNMDVSMNDINHNNKCTLFMSLAQGDYCKTKDYDPQDPRCARVMLTGSVEKLEKDSAEEIFAKSALIAKHPAMSWWPTDHNFFVARLNIIQVSLLDFFGGIKHITPEEYFAAKENNKDFHLKTNDVEAIQIIF